MSSIIDSLRFWISFTSAQVQSLLRVSLALGRRIILGPQLPSWSVLFELTISMMKGSLVKDHRLIRQLIDTDITWLPIFPIGTAIVKGEHLSLDKKFSQSPFEWIYRKADMASPWDESSHSITSELRNKKVLLYFHGGAFVYGTRGGFHTLFLSHLVEATGCVVLFFDYKRSPEHKYPGPQDDCFAAYEFLASQLSHYNIEGVSLYVGGDSAGGALAIDTLKRAQSRGRKDIAGGILLSPWTDIFNYTHKSWEENKNYDFLDPERLLYCANLHHSHDDPSEQNKISPVNGPLRGLPPLLIEVGAKEVFLDQIQVFGDRAKRQGVDVTMNVYDDMIHAFHMLSFTRAEAIFKSIDNIKQFIERHHTSAASSYGGGRPVSLLSIEKKNEYMEIILSSPNAPICCTKDDEEKTAEYIRTSDFRNADIILDLHNVLDTVDENKKLVDDVYRSRVKISALSYVGESNEPGKNRSRARDDISKRIANGQIDYGLLVFKRGRGGNLKSIANEFDSFGSKAWVIRNICQGGPPKSRIFVDDAVDHTLSAKFACAGLSDDRRPRVELFNPKDKANDLPSVLKSFVEESIAV